MIALPADERAAAARLAGGEELGLAALRLAEAHEQAEAANREALAADPVDTLDSERRYGAYRVIRLLGTGGAGRVYLGERSDGQFAHRAAIKVMGGYAVGTAFERRFHEERQILAGLTHPNIAQLLDGNVTPQGEPYLILEFVDGDPLDTWCARQGLDREARIRLFLKVCTAVEFAHRNLVVHLDLKPSNILVTAGGEPKLLDFGASKLLAVAGLPGGVSLPLLTLRYASPEQLQAKPLTTQSDVFSLGVILYELLEGASPFPNPDSWPARLEHALEDRPMPMPVMLHPELATIVRKAMAREPERRYVSVRDLAGDLERYLEQRPILARPSTLGYRAVKYVRRNRLAVAAGALAASAVFAGVASTLWQARKAQRRFDELRQLARYVITDLNAGLQRIPGSTVLQRQSVERSLSYLDRLASEVGGDAGLRVEVAEGYRALGDVLGNPFRANLGDRTAAEAAYRRGLAVLGGTRPSPASRRIAAMLNLQLGGAESFGGAAGAGLDRIRTAVADLRRLASETPANPALRLDAAQGLEFLGTRTTAGGGHIEGSRTAEALRLFDEAAAEARAALPASAAMRILAQIENSRALLYGSTEPAKAIGFHDAAIAWLDKLPPADSSGLDARRLRANILLNTGWAEGQAREYTRSIGHLTEAGGILQAWAAADPGNTNALYQLSGAFRAIGIVRSYRGDHEGAVSAFADAISLHRRLTAVNPANQVYRYLRSELLLRSGNALMALRRPDEARTAAQEGMETLRTLAGAPSPAMTHVFGACRWLVETEVPELRDARAALGHCHKALEMTNRREPDAFSGLAAALHALGDQAGAVAAMREAIALLPPPAPGQAKTRQRVDMESSLARFGRR